MIGLLKEGKVGQFVTGPWNINEYQETFGKDLGVTTLPTDGGKPMKPFLGVCVVGIYLNIVNISIGLKI